MEYDWRIYILKESKIKFHDGCGITSLYIHFPFCRHLCNYCDFFKKIPSGSYNISSFQNLFKKQDIVHEKMLVERGLSLNNLETLYIGGGTPSLWGDEGAHFLAEFLLKKGVKLDDLGEFTLEVNPGTWTDQALSSWMKFGINRFSVGLQALDERFLPLLESI